MEQMAVPVESQDDVDADLEAIHAAGMWTEESKRLTDTQRNVCLTPNVDPELKPLLPPAEAPAPSIPFHGAQTPSAAQIEPTSLSRDDTLGPATKPQVLVPVFVSPIQARHSAQAAFGRQSPAQWHGGERPEPDEDTPSDSPAEDQDGNANVEDGPLDCVYVPDPYSPVRGNAPLRRRSQRLATQPPALFVRRDLHDDAHDAHDGLVPRQPPVTIPVSDLFPATRLRFG
jgi:hypothetical protein